MDLIFSGSQDYSFNCIKCKNISFTLHPDGTARCDACYAKYQYNGLLNQWVRIIKDKKVKKKYREDIKAKKEDNEGGTETAL